MSNETIKGGCSAEQCASRREILAAATVAAAGAVLAGCGGTEDPGTGAGTCTTAPTASSVTVSAASDTLPVGTAMAVLFNKDQSALYIARDAGGYMAIEQTCTHAGCPVSLAPTKDSYICGCHQSKFALDGKVTGGPATLPLKFFALCRNSTGQLVVDTAIKLPSSAARVK